ncbi:protein Vhl [Cimex lectularius]|uniref:von Hippel-Lindau disease tumour suppressor beta domain-containing protein n=1 Tax=Cimex lectularius TaxID=79782 RepID=A0A8I6S688_CIMLE|nr:protein Vhl [Cimex lectularius]
MEPAYYRFLNSSDSYVRVIWLQTKSRRLDYSVLPPGHYLDVNTFATHPWIFEDIITGDHLLADSKCIFLPGNWLEDAKDALKKKGKVPPPNMKIYPVRKIIKLTKPLLSLQIIAMRAIRETGISKEEVDSLELPKTLIELLKGAIARKECCKNHSQVCNLCPFQVQRAHFHMTCVLPDSHN